MNTEPTENKPRRRPMSFRSRYGRLSVWNKIGFWGVIATFAGLLLAVGSFLVPDAKLDDAEVESIAEKVLEKSRRESPALSELADAREEVGQLKEQLVSAIRRADEAEHRRNTPAAREAIEDLRRAGDPTKLLSFLVEDRDRLQDDLVERNREIAALAYVTGEIGIAESALNAILTREPDDLYAINRIGAIHELRGELDDAERSFQRVLALARRQGSVGWQAAAYGNLGLIYQTRGDLDQAEAMHRNALEAYKKLRALAGVASAYSNLGVIYWTRGDLDRAEQTLRKALKINERFGWLEGMADNYAALESLNRVFRDK